MKTGKDVRRHHYEFAHRALPSVMFGHIDENLGYLVDKAQPFIDNLWNFVGKKVTERGQTAIAGAGPRVERLSLNPGAMWVVTMPPCEAMAEALYVGIVPMRPSGTPDERMGVFTLEYSFDLGTHEQYYVLCRWTAGGMHQNLGLKVEPNVAAFSSAVLNALRAPN